MVFFVAKVISFILAIVAISFILPIICGLYFGEIAAVNAFLPPMIFCLVLASVLFAFGRKRKAPRFSARASYAMVAAAWLFVSLLGAVPFMLSGTIPDFADAFFESVSGFSTTGATILSEVESLPHCINLWRLQTHWLGGMGIVMLTVALMPLLGVGGFQLIKAETTGPEKGKMTPKMAVTAKILWFIYLGMTVLETILLLIAGMPFWEALAHSFATLGTGGFSSRNASIGAFNSPAIEWICAVFMGLSGVNFSLYYMLLIGKGKSILQNSEFKAYILLLFVSTAIVTFSILPLYASFGQALRYSVFQVVSINTTTGFATADFTLWPPLAQLVIFMLFFVGGCSGSTGGGFKVVRWVILGKQAHNEMKSLLHPHGVFTIRLDGRAGRKDVVFGVAAFTFLYLATIVVTTFVAALEGTEIFSAFTAAISMVGNIGPGFGLVGPSQNYGFFTAPTKLWFCLAMIAGRLELYTIVLFFFPGFYEKR